MSTPKHPRASVAMSSLRSIQPASFFPSLVPGGGWIRGCKRTVVLGGMVLGGTGTVVIATGLGCSGGFREGRALPEGREGGKEGWREGRNVRTVDLLPGTPGSRGPIT